MPESRRGLLRGRAALACVLLAGLGWAASAVAAGYPSQPVRLVVPYPPGGGVDTIARAVAQPLAEALGQSVVIENRAGAGSQIGVAAAMRAEPDGYTLLIADPALPINQVLRQPAPYDARTGLVAVGRLTASPYVMVRTPGLPAETVQAIGALSRQRADGVTFATAGVGTAAHMAGELLRLRTGANLVHVPYKGGALAMSDLVSGLVDTSITTTAAARVYLAEGRLAGVATTGRTRSAAFPGLPALAETLPGFEVLFWTGLFAPPGTPPEAVQALQRALAHALASPALREALARSGDEIAPLAGPDFAAFVAGQVETWARVVREAGLGH
ncbi:Bug family tripartite tricarboxylate transporter substrate binding protein [Bordetella sp. 2513F-2]